MAFSRARSDRYRIVRQVGDLKNQLQRAGIDTGKVEAGIAEKEAEIAEWDAKIKRMQEDGVIQANVAVVDPQAKLAGGVKVGPYAVIGPGVELGEGCEVGAGASVQGPSRFGAGNRIFPHACVGFEPQDLKYEGEPTMCRIGDGTVIREYVTISRGTRALGRSWTRVSS